MSLFEHRLLVLRQDLQSSAQQVEINVHTKPIWPPPSKVRDVKNVSQAMTRGGLHSLEPLAVESELREVQLRIGELQRKRKGLLDQLDQLLRRDPFKLQAAVAVASTPRQERPVLSVPDGKGISFSEVSRGTSSVFSESKPTNGGNTSKPKKAESLAECLAVLDSLQEEMNQNKEAKEVKEVSPETEEDKKYLELIDLLTNKMFDSESNVGTKQKKANSLPRSGTSIPEPRLRKSSSQVFSPSKVSSSKPLGQLSAYERLFGVPSPSSSRCTSPVVKKTGVPMIIPKVRRGSGERPTALGRLSSSPARSHENVNLLPPCTSGEEKKKEKISLHSIDGLLSAPDKIEIPSRYQPEVEKTLMSLTEQESRSAKATLIKKMLVETGATCTLPNRGLLSLLAIFTSAHICLLYFQITV